MKKIFTLICILIGIFHFNGVFAAETINNFEVFIQINEDSSINVQESITYDFGVEKRHGIYREIPIKYQARGGRYNLQISDIWVGDNEGNLYQSKITYPSDYVNIKIGDPDKYVTGLKVYNIHYKIKRAINFFEAHDELYWNSTGDEWEVPIKKSKTIVYLPRSVEKSVLKTACFSGSYGSTLKCTSMQYQYDGQGLVSAFEYNQDLLNPREGLTVVAGFSKGLVKEPTLFEKILDTVKDNWIFVLPVITFFVMYFVWRKKGKDPEGQGTIVTQFDAPDKLTPVEIGTVVDEKINRIDISAEIIHLAVDGYLKIKRIEGKGLLKSDDYEFEKLKDESGLKNDFDKKLMEGLFGSSNSVVLSSLKNDFYKDLDDIKKKVYKSTIDKGYFPSHPHKVTGIYVAIGFAIGFLSIILFSSYFGGFGIFSSVLVGLIIVVFGIFMPVKTKKGVLAKEHILGLKNYLTVAEKDRLEFHNAPEKNPEIFEKLLPFAMALQVENQWAKQFEGIYNEQPSWYSDSSGARFNSMLLVSNLNNFNSKAYSTLASRPSSASSGGSGFSGGGGGGGFGGGGGGSW